MVIIIPSAGQGSRFREKGYKMSKPLIRARGIPMIVRVANMFDEQQTKLVICRAEDEEAIKLAFPFGAVPETLVVNKLTAGAALTILCAEALIPDDEEVCIVNSDAIFKYDLHKFFDEVKGYDGGILTFPVEGGPWSYVEAFSNGLVTRVAEKKPISNVATAGLYYFRRWDVLRKAICDMVSEDDRTNNEFYLCPAYNYMIRDGARIKSVEMRADQFISLGTPEDLVKYNEQLSLA